MTLTLIDMTMAWPLSVIFDQEQHFNQKKFLAIKKFIFYDSDDDYI